MYGPRYLIRFILTSVILCAAPMVQALEKPSGEVILQVSGKIELTNGADHLAQFDLAMLQQFPQKIVKTSTPWTDGTVTFKGVLMRDVMKSLGATGSSVQAIAFNDYSVDIPTADYEQYDIILAYERDGEIMKLRSKGPLWIIYPWDDHEELKTELYHSRSIWQLKALDVQ